MFDEVVFDQPLPCPQCGADIDRTQTHAFEETLSRYRIHDCVGHAEDTRVVREELWCERCRKMLPTCVYFVLVRGILVAIEKDYDSAQRRLRDLSVEELALWYHDLHRDRGDLRRRLSSHRHFLHELVAFARDSDAYRNEPKVLAPLWARYFRETTDIADAVEQFLRDHDVVPDDVAEI